MADPVHAFISYRRQEPDSSLAHEFARALEAAGHEAFIDTGIRWGANWAREIRQALERSQYLVLLLSREAAASEMVMEEVAIAIELARERDGFPAILPVRVQFPFSEPLSYQISAHLRTIQQVSWEGPGDTRGIIERLLATIADMAQWPAEAQTEPARTHRPEAPEPQFDPRDLIVPGGAFDVDSTFYVVRDADEEVRDAVQQPRALVTVRAPRQTGKTSLIMRAYAAARASESGLQAAFVDLQALAHDDFQNLASIWRAIVSTIADQIGIRSGDRAPWEEGASHDRSVSRFLDRVVSADSGDPLLFCMDEVDRVFKYPVSGDFFSSVRAFYNRGAMDPSWKKVRWLFATSSEPSFFIKDLTQSPFNVGQRVELDAFSSDEVRAFAGRHDLELAAEELERVMDYLGGRPYLVHLLLYKMTTDPDSRGRLFDASTAGDGVFRDHLHRYLVRFQQEGELASAMKSVVMGRGCRDARLAERLEAAGLTRRDEAQQVVPFCRLYADFFGNQLD